MKHGIRMLGIIICMIFFKPAISQNNALNFDGIKDYVQWGDAFQSGVGPFASTPIVSPLVGSDFSIEFWIKSDLATSPSTNQILFAFNMYHTSYESNRLLFGINAGGNLYIHDGSNNGLSTPRNLANSFVADDTCHHIAFTYDFSTSAIRVYLDGSSIGGPNSSNFTLDSTDIFNLGQEWDSLYMLRSQPSQFYYGDMDNIRIWSSLRTATEIQNNMNNSLSPLTVNLIANFKANQGTPSGSNLLISSLTNATPTATAYDGTLVGFNKFGPTSNFVLNPCEICTAVDNPSFTTITSNVTADIHWDGKIYIPDNTIITVNNAILDITTADVVFGECSGIDFTNGAQLRANNTVFRPCNLNDTWRGINFYNTLDFDDNSTSIINECTFKNAQRAIFAYNDDEVDIRTTNNLFSNCKTGISISGGDFMRSISGNTFLIDALIPEFMESICSYGNQGEYYGIYSEDINYQEAISQNDFIAPNFSTVNFTGIESISDGQIQINSNNFTNTHRSVLLDRSSNAKIESNDIKVTHDFIGFEHQIAVLEGQNTLISGNDIVNTTHFNPTDWLGNNSAIYCYSGARYEIKENNVTGFETGIQCEEIDWMNITDNLIENCHFFGIYQRNLRVAKTSCNVINMQAQIEGNAVGIGYITHRELNHNNEISSNCIFETNIAIDFLGLTPIQSSELPIILNNYMYNYSEYGIQSNNMYGDIGTSPSPSSGAGQNSFISNNGLGLTADIGTSPNPLTSFGNFGINFTSGAVNLNGNNVNSTASCGNQIDLANSSIGSMEICDDFSSGYIAMIDQNNNLQEGFANEIRNATQDDLLYVLFNLVPANNIGFEIFYKEALSKGVFYGNESDWLSYYYHLLKSEDELALSILKSISPQNQEEIGKVQLEMIHLELENKLNSTQIHVLESIASSDSKYAHSATSILYRFGEVNSRKFYATKVADRISNDTKIKKVGDHTFTVYPNPAIEQITFEYAIGEKEIGEMVIADITGKQISKYILAHQVSSQTIDISKLPSGIYTLSLRSNESTIAYSKLIKN